MPKVIWTRDTNDADEDLLPAGETLVTEWFDASKYEGVSFVNTCDEPGVYWVEYSINRADVDSSPAYKHRPGITDAPHTLAHARRWFRIRYTNGDTDQTFHRMQLMEFPGQLRSPLHFVVGPQADAITVRSIGEEAAIAAGLFAGWSIVNKFGRNKTVGTGAAEDVWSRGNLYTGQPAGAAAEAIEFSSSSSEDGAGGDGVHTIMAQGLDDQGVLTTAAGTMDGTGWVALPGLWTRLFRAWSITGADGDAAAVGVITFRGVSTQTVFAEIPIGENQTQMAAFTIPANTTGYLRRVYARVGRETGGSQDPEVSIKLLVRTPGGLYRDLYPQRITVGSPLNDPFYGGRPLEPLTDVLMRAESTTQTGTHVTGGFDIVLREDLLV